MAEEPEAGRRHESGSGRPAEGPSRPTNALSVGRLLGVEIRLHWTFLILVILVMWLEWSRGGHAVANGLLWIAAVFGSVLVHELSHCVVARRRGVEVEDILLTPIGGLSQLHDMPEAPADELAIAIVGPATSLVLAVVAAAAGLALGARLWPPTLFAGAWLARLAWLNLVLGAFNMLPALPMDGGRVLRAALARHRDRRSATLLAVRVARILAGAMLVVGLLYDVWLLFIGLFLLLGAAAEESEANRPEHGPPAGPDAGGSSSAVDLPAGRGRH
ncbi:MAG TPA: site-2 protease family protein [Acidimicrobiales bacterium]|nr:site-2 protease family protein [Acidimicrobiales bacterium]